MKKKALKNVQMVQIFSRIVEMAACQSEDVKAQYKKKMRTSLEAKKILLIGVCKKRVVVGGKKKDAQEPWQLIRSSKDIDLTWWFDMYCHQKDWK